MNLHIQGFEAHDDTRIDIDPKGVTTIEGASESGKSATGRALLWLLTGKGVDGGAITTDSIRDGADAMQVVVTSPRTGTRFVRRMTRARTITRSVEPTNGPPQRGLTDDAFLAALLGKDPPPADLVRLVVVPFAWTGLLAAERGRPLRDLLERAIPGKSADELLAETLAEGEPHTAKDAAAWQTKANGDLRWHEANVAKLHGVRAGIAARHVDAPTADDVAAARATVAAWEAEGAVADDLRAAHNGWTNRRAAFDHGVAEHAAWQRRAAAVSEPTDPEPTDEDLAAAERAAATFAAAVAAHGEAVAKWRDAVDARLEAELALRLWRGRRDDIPQPTAGVLTDDVVANLRAEIAGLMKVEAARAKAVEAARAKVPAAPDSTASSRIVAEIGLIEQQLADARRRAGLLDDVPCKGGPVLVPDGTSENGRSERNCAGCPLLTDARMALDTVAGFEAALASANARLEASEAAYATAVKAHETAAAALTKAEADHAEAVGRLAEKQQSLAEDEAARAEWVTYKFRVDALGPEPELPPHPGAAAPASPVATDDHRLDELRERRKAWVSYRAALAALGDEPAIPPDPGPAPTWTEPVYPRAAADVLARATAAEREAEARAAQLAEADAAIETAEGGLAEAKAVAERAAWVLTQVRGAPGLALRAKLDALSCEPFVLSVPDEGAAIEVRIRSASGVLLPWELASDGRRIVADAAFRSALRAVAWGGRCAGLPLFIDGVQSVGGQTLPDVPGPVVHLRTTDGPGFTVGGVAADGPALTAVGA